MPGRNLPNKPLGEAILEFRWLLPQTGTQQVLALGQVPSLPIVADPNSKLLLGRLYERLRSRYPNYEQLPTASVPEAMVPYIVQHEFRSAGGKWPWFSSGQVF